ncbi:MAG: hypothetical protein ACRDRX_03155 [Pseudonocardiaceae bacterium]
MVGPSGSGKSSLVRAGLLPEIAEEPGWRCVAPILPGADPVTALARELAAMARRIGVDWTVEHVCQRFTDSGLTGLADELLLADPDGPQRRLLVVVVDQAEELLTQSAPADRNRFTELLRPAVRGPVRLVGTLRPRIPRPAAQRPRIDQLAHLPLPAAAAAPRGTARGDRETRPAGRDRGGRGPGGEAGG